MSSNADKPLLSAAEVRKNYQIGKRQIEVLKGVSLTVQSGEFVALQGASGAGKSTLLHLLGGLDKADSGRIYFEERELTNMSGGSMAELRGGRMGFIFQSYHLLPELDALENVCAPARLMRRSPDWCIERGTMLLNRVGLGHRLDHRPPELSGGEQQRVAIARSLMNQPILLLADEPTGNLDSNTGGEIMDLLRELQKEQGTTMVIATHDVRVAERAERVVRLVDGLIVAG
jgi:lipoprotein-releasing system ATP-binding protein